MNSILGWKRIIRTAQNAAKLRKLLNRLNDASSETVMAVDRFGMPSAYLRQRIPPTCPASVLYGEAKAGQFYADPALRPALDAWDTGEVDKAMLRKICLEIENAQSK